MNVMLTWVRIFRSHIAKHASAYAAACAMAAMVISPLFLFAYIAGPAYQGITIADHGIDELWYASRVKEALEGHALGNPLLAIGKEGVDQHFSVYEQVFAGVWRLLGLAEHISVPFLLGAYAFLNVAGVVLCLYALLRSLGCGKDVSVVGAVAVVGGYAAFLPNLLAGISVYGRAFSPAVPSVFLFLFLFFFAKAVRTGRWLFVVWSGVVLLFLTYLYYYAWSFGMAFAASYAALSFARHDRMGRRLSLAAGAVGLAGGAYQVARLAAYAASPQGASASYFHWVQHTRMPEFSWHLFLLLALAAAAFFFQRTDWRTTFFGALALGSIMVFNQHVVTGQMIQTGHYLSLILIPSLFVVAFCLFDGLVRGAAARRILLGAVLLFSILNTAVGQYRAAITNLPEKLHRQAYAPILHALNKEETGVVLSADSHDAYLVTIFTSHDLFWSYGFGLFNVPTAYAERALSVYLYLNRDARNDPVAFLSETLRNPNASSIYGNPQWFYGGIYEAVEGRASGLDWDVYHALADRSDSRLLPLRREMLARIADAENRLQSAGDAVKTLREMGVSHIIWDRTRNPEWDLSFLEKEEVVESEGIVLYRLYRGEGG